MQFEDLEKANFDGIQYKGPMLRHPGTGWHTIQYNARPSFEELGKDNFDDLQFKGPMLGHPGSGIRYNARLPFEELEKDNFESKYFSSSKGSYNYNFTASDYN